MENILTQLRGFKYFTELAFVVALLLIMWAWKFGIEGLGD